MKQTNRIYQLVAWGIIALSIVVCIYILVAHPVNAAESRLAVRLRTASALAVTITILGGSCMLLGGIKSFKKQLHIAYILLASGVILFGVALLQLPIIGFYDWWNSWYANSGVLVLPFVFATALIYAGVRRLALLLEVKSVLISFPFVICLAFIITIISFIAGHYLSRYRAVVGTDTFIAVVAWCASYCTCAVFLMGNIIKRIGPSYKNAMQSLLVALAALAFSGWHEYAIDFFQGNADWYVSHGASFIPFIISGLLVVRAGYALCTLDPAGVMEKNIVPVSLDVMDNEYTSAITYAAGLASHPDDIDFILDDLRLVTSNLADGRSLSADDKRRLINVYLKIELYLVYHDPLRNFSRDEIRTKLSPGLQAEIAKRTPVTTPTETPKAAAPPATAAPA